MVQHTLILCNYQVYLPVFSRTKFIFYNTACSRHKSDIILKLPKKYPQVYIHLKSDLSPLVYRKHDIQTQNKNKAHVQVCKYFYFSK